MNIMDDESIPRYLKDSFVSTLSRGRPLADGTDLPQYDTEFPSILRGSELAGEGASCEEIISQVIYSRD